MKFNGGGGCSGCHGSDSFGGVVGGGCSGCGVGACSGCANGRHDACSGGHGGHGGHGCGHGTGAGAYHGGSRAHSVDAYIILSLHWSGTDSPI